MSTAVSETFRAGFSIANQISNQVNLQSSPGLIGDHLKCRFSISNQHQIVHQISSQVNWRFSANQRDDRRLKWYLQDADVRKLQ